MVAPIFGTIMNSRMQLSFPTAPFPLLRMVAIGNGILMAFGG
jgi:hypothetical protein